jgi:uncharacterized damage-inducible protein DinB
MSLNQSFLDELEREARPTRKMLELVPLEKADWAPHKKSTPLGRLATHIAELPGWTSVTLDYRELDFAKSEYKPRIAESNSELINIYEENLEKAEKSLKNTDDEVFSEEWTLRNGEQVYFTLPKIIVLRSTCFNHLIHHRAQLGVYLRLLDVPLPGIYGPTADEPM